MILLYSSVSASGWRGWGIGGDGVGDDVGGDDGIGSAVVPCMCAGDGVGGVVGVGCADGAADDADDANGTDGADGGDDNLLCINLESSLTTATFEKIVFTKLWSFECSKS